MRSGTQKRKQNSRERPLALINACMICETTGLAVGAPQRQTNRTRTSLPASESGSRERVDQRILCGQITRLRGNLGSKREEE